MKNIFRKTTPSPKEKVRVRTFFTALLLIIIFSLPSFAGEVTRVAYLNKNDLGVNAIITINDNLKSEEDANPTWYAAKRKHLVKLAYTRENKTDLPSLAPWTYIITYKIYQTSTPSTFETGSVEVNYTYGSVNNSYQAINEYTPATVGYGDVTIMVTGITTTGTPPADIRLELMTITERYTDLETSLAPAPLIYYNSVTSELAWGYVPGAEEYDVEWTFIDAQDAAPTFSNSSPQDPFNYKAPVRVTTSDQYYLIDQYHPAGKLYFRVRAVGRHISIANDYTHVSYGDWGYKQTPSSSVPLSFTISTDFQANKNWNYTAAFAEEGKTKKGISYTDGGGKSRQSQATMNSDNTVIVGENKYDREGRPVVAMLPTPVPVTDPLHAFDYKSLFNRNTNSTPTEYNFSDFERGGTPAGSVTAVGNLAGAGKYYSSANPFLASDPFAAYTDDAGGAATPSTDDAGYPFTQVSYTRDNTGRISKTTGGAGSTFALSGLHELSYFYGTPNSTELHRMFGTNVGLASHYKKNFSVDANGQVSVSYYDQEGRVVATCLAGTAPANLTPLETNETTLITVSLNDNNVVSSEQNKSTVVSQLVNVTPNTSHSFSYDMKGVIYGVNADMPGLILEEAACKPAVTQPLCADCKYKLEISITDPDGLSVQPSSFSIPPLATTPALTWAFSNPVAASCGTLPYFNQYSEAPITFSLNFSKIGNYSISKTLSLDTTGIYLKIRDAFTAAGYTDTYRDDLITCYIDHTDFTECDVNCEQHCKRQVLLDNPTWAADQVANAALINAAVASCIAEKCNSVGICKDNCRVQVLDANPTWATDQTTYAAQITGAVNTCIASQCNSIQPERGECDVMLDQMIIDVSPGGDEYLQVYSLPTTQFWARVNPMLISGTTCTDPNSNTVIYIVDQNCAPVSLSTLQNEANWKPEWAAQLVKAHRDYCHYLSCVTNEPGVVYNVTLAGIADADVANGFGYLDPLGFGRASSTTGFPAGVGAGGSDVNVTTLATGYDPVFATQPSIEASCDKYNLLANELLNGFPNNVVPFNNSYTDIWHYVFNPNSFIYSSSGYNLAYTAENRWKVFRGLYLNAKLKVEKGLTDGYGVTHGETSIFYTYDEDGNAINSITLTPSSTNPCAVCTYYQDSKAVTPPVKFEGSEKDIRSSYDLVNDCGQVCEMNAVHWMEQLQHYADSTGCTNWNSLSASNKNTIRLNLLSLCQTDCGVTNPMGFILGAHLTTTAEPIQTYINNIQSILNTAGCGTALSYLSAGSPYTITCPATNGVTVTATKPNQCFGELVAYLNGNVLGSLANTCFNLNNAGGMLASSCLGGQYLSVSGNEIKLSTNSGCDPVRCQSISLYKGDGTAMNISDITFIGIPVFTNSSPLAAAPSGLIFKNISCVVNTVAGPLLVYVYEKQPSSCQEIPVVETVEITGTGYCIANGYNNTAAFTVPVNYNDLREQCIINLKARDTALANEHFKMLLRTFTDHYMKAHFTNCFSGHLAENFNYQYNSNEYHYTLYYYDQAGNLVQTAPPKGVHLVPLAAFTAGVYNGTTEPLHTYLTRYMYNGLNQVRSQETPDGGLTHFYYDDKGRLRFSQNAKQLAAAGAYSYTIYDDLSRITEVGQSTQLYQSSQPFYNGVNDLAFPGTDRSQVTLTAYDEAPANTTLQSLFANGQQFLRTRVATTQFYENTYDGTAANLSYATHYSYDQHGNVNELVQDNTLLASLGTDNQYKYMRYKYQLVSGNVTEVAYQPGKPDQFYHRYIYDADNRLTIAMTNNHPIILRDGVTLSGVEGWEKDAKYFYYKHGPLARTETGEDKVQGTDYAYSINGWLKGINSTTLVASREMGKDANLVAGLPDPNNSNNRIASDALGYTLGYFDGDYNSVVSPPSGQPWLAETASTPLSNGASGNLFNGNIAHTTGAFLNNNETPVPTMGKAYRYDQLNRLKNVNAFTNMSGMTDNVSANNTFASAVDNGTYKEIFAYDANGNITTAERWGNGTKMDEFTYNYEDVPSYASYTKNTNKLRFVNDNVSLTTNYTDDIDHQNKNFGNENYFYDAIGNLTADVTEEIANIEWNVYGKVTAVNRTTGSTKMDLIFKYDANGNRICKIAKPRSAGTQQTEENWTYTYYVRDAQGNVMAVYNRDVNASGGTLTDEVKVKEHDIYGSSRIGIETKDVTLGGKSYTYSTLTYTNGEIGRPASPSDISAATIENAVRLVGDKQYELTNHLGNVMVVVSDKKQGVHTSGSTSDAEYYTSDVISSGDNFAYGGKMNGRSYNPTGTDFGFNGKREDPELYGEGNSYDFGARNYDPRLGRMDSQDKFNFLYPFLNPYNGMGNNPISNIDYGGDLIIFVNGYYPGHEQDTYLELADYWDNELKANAAATLNDYSAVYFNGSEPLIGAKAAIRKLEGAQMAANNAIWFREQLDKERKDTKNPKAVLNFVSHSMGAAYAAGMVNALKDAVYTDGPKKGEKIFTDEDFGSSYFLAPYQAEDIDAPTATRNYQYSHSNDAGAGNIKIKGIAKNGGTYSSTQYTGVWSANNVITPHFNETFKDVFTQINQKALPYTAGGVKGVPKPFVLNFKNKVTPQDKTRVYNTRTLSTNDTF